MSQTSYPRDRAVAVSGMPVDLTECTIVSFVAAEVIPPGRLCILNGSGQLELPKLAAFTKPVGVSMFDVTRMQPAVPAAGFSYQIGDLVPVMRAGRVYADFNGGSAVALVAANVKHADTTATHRGKFTGSATSMVADAQIDALATAKFLAPAGVTLPTGVCAVEFDLMAEDTARFQAAELVTASTQRGTALLVSGTVTITSANVTANSRILATMKTPVGTTLTTGYIARASARTPGVPGSSSFTLEAIVAAGTINVADGSTVDWAVLG